MNLFKGKSYYYVKLKENIKTLLTYIPQYGTNEQIYVYFSNITDSNGTHISAIQQTENIYFVKDKEEGGYTYFDVQLHIPVLEGQISTLQTYNYKISRLRLLKDLPSTYADYTETLSQMDEYLGFDFVDANGAKVSWTMEGEYSNSLSRISTKDDSGKNLDIGYIVNFPSLGIEYKYIIFTNSIRIKVSGINVTPKNIKLKNWWTDMEPTYFGTLINVGTFTEQITRERYTSIRDYSLPEIYYWESSQTDRVILGTYGIFTNKEFQEFYITEYEADNDSEHFAFKSHKGEVIFTFPVESLPIGQHEEGYYLCVFEERQPSGYNGHFLNKTINGKTYYCPIKLDQSGTTIDSADLSLEVDSAGNYKVVYSYDFNFAPGYASDDITISVNQDFYIALLSKDYQIANKDLWNIEIDDKYLSDFIKCYPVYDIEQVGPFGYVGSYGYSLSGIFEDRIVYRKLLEGWGGKDLDLRNFTISADPGFEWIGKRNYVSDGSGGSQDLKFEELYVIFDPISTTGDGLGLHIYRADGNMCVQLVIKDNKSKPYLIIKSFNSLPHWINEHTVGAGYSGYSTGEALRNFALFRPSVPNLVFNASGNINFKHIQYVPTDETDPFYKFKDYIILKDNSVFSKLVPFDYRIQDHTNKYSGDAANYTLTDNTGYSGKTRSLPYSNYKNDYTDRDYFEVTLHTDDKGVYAMVKHGTTSHEALNVSTHYYVYDQHNLAYRKKNTTDWQYFPVPEFSYAQVDEYEGEGEDAVSLRIIGNTYIIPKFYLDDVNPGDYIDVILFNNFGLGDATKANEPFKVWKSRNDIVYKLADVSFDEKSITINFNDTYIDTTMTYLGHDDWVLGTDLSAEGLSFDTEFSVSAQIVNTAAKQIKASIYDIPVNLSTEEKRFRIVSTINGGRSYLIIIQKGISIDDAQKAYGLYFKSNASVKFGDNKDNLESYKSNALRYYAGYIPKVGDRINALDKAIYTGTSSLDIPLEDSTRTTINFAYNEDSCYDTNSLKKTFDIQIDENNIPKFTIKDISDIEHNMFIKQYYGKLFIQPIIPLVYVKNKSGVGGKLYTSNISWNMFTEALGSLFIRNNKLDNSKSVQNISTSDGRFTLQVNLGDSNITSGFQITECGFGSIAGDQLNENNILLAYVPDANKSEYTTSLQNIANLISSSVENNILTLVYEFNDSIVNYSDGDTFGIYLGTPYGDIKQLSIPEAGIPNNIKYYNYNILPIKLNYNDIYSVTPVPELRWTEDELRRTVNADTEYTDIPFYCNFGNPIEDDIIGWDFEGFQYVERITISNIKDEVNNIYNLRVYFKRNDTHGELEYNVTLKSKSLDPQIRTDNYTIIQDYHITPVIEPEVEFRPGFYYVEKEGGYVSLRFYWNLGIPAEDLNLETDGGEEYVLEAPVLPTTKSEDGYYQMTMKVAPNTDYFKHGIYYSLRYKADSWYVAPVSIFVKAVDVPGPEYYWITQNFRVDDEAHTENLQLYYEWDEINEINTNTTTPRDALNLTSVPSITKQTDLPNELNSSKQYNLSVNIPKNTENVIKQYTIQIISHYAGAGYENVPKQIVITQDKGRLLYFTESVIDNIPAEGQYVNISYFYNYGIPSEKLNVITDLDSFRLHTSLSTSERYTNSVLIPANTTYEAKSYSITLTDKERPSLSTVIVIHQLPKERPQEELYFTTDKISDINSSNNYVWVDFYYNGDDTPYNALTIDTNITEPIVLPNNISDTKLYRIQVNIGINTDFNPKEYFIRLRSKTSEQKVTEIQLVQDAKSLSAPQLYFSPVNYTIIATQTQCTLRLFYSDVRNLAPAEKLIVDTNIGRVLLPAQYNDSGIYDIVLTQIPKNIDYDDKYYFVRIYEEEFNTQTIANITQTAKQQTQLYWIPDSITVNAEQENVNVNYFWNNYMGGSPKDYLNISSDIPGFSYNLPSVVHEDGNYQFNVNIGENTGLNARQFNITIKTNDKFYTSVLTINQLGKAGEADNLYYFAQNTITAPASGIVPQGYISNKLIGDIAQLTGQYDIISIPYWIKSENIRFDKNTGLLIIDKETPNVFAERLGKIQILFYSVDGKTHAAEFNVKQLAGEIDSTNISPIWRDSWVNIDADYNYFRLVNKKTNEIYFNGQTIQGELAQFKLNNVISDYLNVWSSFGSSLQNGNNFTTSPVEISVSCSKNGSDFDYTLPDSYKFIWDYSYDKHVPGILFNGNIINYYDPRQKMMISSSNRSNYEMITKVETIFANANKSTIEEYSLLPGEMHATFVPAYSGPGDGAVKIKVSCTVQGQTEVKEYVPKCTKANYVLHYVNRYGQVCWMLFAGKQIKSDKITSSKFVQAYDNNYRYNFENVVYQNKVEESWQLTTSYLTDKQSENLTDLYSSPIVFLEDLNAANTDNIIAVTVETKSVDYKNYKNQGKFFTHTIKVQNAQNKFILL